MASLTEQSPRSVGHTNTQAYGKTEVQSKELQISYSADDAEMGVSRCALSSDENGQVHNILCENLRIAAFG